MINLHTFMEKLIKKTPAQPEFHQAVNEVLESVGPVVEEKPEYRKAMILERMVEPERVIMFRVPWLYDRNEICVNTGYRIEMSSATECDEFDPMIALEKLIEAPTRLSCLLKGLDEEFLAKQPGEDRWSIRQFMTHIRDAGGVFNGRVKQFTIEENPVLTSQAVWEWARSDEAGPGGTLAILEDFRVSRAETVDELKRFPLKDWWREGQHDEFGTVTLKQQASYFAAHELTHISQIGFLVSS